MATAKTIADILGWNFSRWFLKQKTHAQKLTQHAHRHTQTQHPDNTHTARHKTNSKRKQKHIGVPDQSQTKAYQLDADLK